VWPFGDRSGPSGIARGILRCSFCGKSQNDVRKLIAGPKVYICDACIELCNDILAEEREEELRPVEAELRHDSGSRAAGTAICRLCGSPYQWTTCR